MIRDPDLAALGADLERLGHVVVPHGDHLCVRLPLFASVRVRTEAGRLRCYPQFGALPRSRALVLGAAALTAIVGGVFHGTGVSPEALTTAFGGIMLGVVSACRFVLTESCVTRVQTLWASGSRPALAAGGLAEPSRGALPDAAAPAALPPAPPARRARERPGRLATDARSAG